MYRQQGLVPGLWIADAWWPREMTRDNSFEYHFKVAGTRWNKMGLGLEALGCGKFLVGRREEQVASLCFGLTGFGGCLPPPSQGQGKLK